MSNSRQPFSPLYQIGRCRAVRLVFPIIFLALTLGLLCLAWLPPARVSSAQQSTRQQVLESRPTSLSAAVFFTPTFTVQYFGSGNWAGSVAIADVNGDGRLDLIQGVINAALVVFLNDGQGGFDTVIPLGGAQTNYSLAVGDVNGDGALDIIQGNNSQQSRIYLNSGQGGFSAGMPFGDAYSTTSLAVGDVNGDGALDIIQGNNGEQSVLYLNDGDGIFYWGTVNCAAPPAHVRCLSGTNNTEGIALGDMNGDGALDIVQGNHGQQSRLYLNEGEGMFGAGQTFGFSYATNSIALGDINGDGSLDVIQGNYNQQSAINLNDGHGVFSGIGILFGGTSAVRSIAVGDVNGDGRLDVIQGNDGQLSVINLNEGMGAFSSITFGNPDHTYDTAVGDVNGDGALDIIQCNGGWWGPQQSAVYLNNGLPGFGVDLPVGIGQNTQSLAVGDMNADGALDLVQGNNGQSYIYLNDGQAGFAIERPFGSSQNVQSIAAGDMNNDGALDIIQSTYTQNFVYLNVGAGQFYTGVVDCEAPPSSVWCWEGGFSTQDVAIGDMNGDGLLDVVQGNNGQSYLYLNDKQHGLSDAGLPFGPAANTQSVALGDLNGDGALDIIQGNGFGFYWRASLVYLNDGLGGFGTGTPLDDLKDTRAVAVGDVDGDGSLDVILGSRGQQNNVYLNDGHGNFTRKRSFGGPYEIKHLAVGDVNNDGALDIIQANSGQASLIYLNNGQGGFNAGLVLGNSMFASSHTVGDMDSDGTLDVVQGNAGEASKLYFNTRFRAAGLPDNPPEVWLARPGRTSLANFFSASDIVSDSVIPITYTLSDRESDPVRLIRAYYSPDGGGRWLPAIANTQTLTTNLMTLGTALSFDGVDDYMSTSNLSGLLTGNVSHTVEAWIKITSLPSYRAWLMVLGNPGMGAHHWLIDSDGRTQFGVWDTGGQTAQLHPVIRPGVWTHVAMTFDGQLLKGYVNGQLIGSVSATFDLQGVPLRLAQAQAGDNYFHGLFDEVRVWNVVRTQAQIQATMQQIPPGSSPDLIAYWRFNESRGVTAFDQTAHHNQAILVNGPAWTAVAFSHVYYWDTFASGLFGQSDNVVFRLEAYPFALSAVFGPGGTYKYVDNMPNYQRLSSSATTFPFRVRGTQVRVVSDTQPITNAVVYRLPAGQSGGGSLLSDAAGIPFHTDGQGYLQGRGELKLGDQLLALAPVHSDIHYEGVVDLDGVDDYVIKNPLNAAPITATTVSFWLRSDDHSGQGTPFSYATASNADEFLITNYNNLAIHRGALNVTTGVSLTDGMWHHVAVTWREADGQVKLYKDGSAAYTGTLAASSLITGGSLVLGQDQGSIGGGFDPVRAFKGSLDEIHVWNVAFDETRIPDDMLKPLDGDEDGLVLAWSFDAAAAAIIRDRSASRNDGSLFGSVWNSRAFGGYTVYHTNGVPTAMGLSTHPVTQTGVQLLTVSAAHPLILFDLNVSLEWDAHKQTAYLQQLEDDLAKASAYLYDFTNGQAALGRVTVRQNADDWLSSQVVVYATNRLRPLAVQGGLVTEPITDPQRSNVAYTPGQVRMGAVWNRYGEPGGDISDWPLALAHELSHYLLYQEDVYLGLNENGLLIPLNTCTGSVMGDMYNPDNTELVYEQQDWDTHCADTLANRTLGRTEWTTNRLWYPWLITPTLANVGPSRMPFDLTRIVIADPLSPTNTLDDPTFYIDYQAGESSSSEARTYLIRSSAQGDYVVDLGSPLGGQNRVYARGAQPGDRLCVFDAPRRQFGCEIIELGDERLSLKADPTWKPVVQLTPVNSQTIAIEINGLTSTLPFHARLYPENGYGGESITLTLAGAIYSGTFHLDFPAMMGKVQIWIDEPGTEDNPRREAMVTYSMGGNPGKWPALRGSWPALRGSWPALRGSWPALRGSWSTSRSSSAPLASPGGQMLFFTPDPASIQEGNLYTIEGMASLPSLPSGKTAIGQSYSLIASSNVTQVITGSISFQYLSMDVLAEQAHEDQLTIHFWNGRSWQALDTVRSPYFNMVSAPSHGPGVYTLLAGVTTPQLDAIDPMLAVNDMTTTLTIGGRDFLPPVDVLLIGPTTTYTLPVISVSPISITVALTRGLPAHQYAVQVVNRYDAASSESRPFALYDPADACFYDFFESGSNKWQRGGTWNIITLPDGNQALTDSPGGSYGVAVSPTLTATTSVTSLPFSLNGCSQPVLTFRHDYVIDNRPPSQDWGRVEISTDDGGTWRELVRYTGGLRSGFNKVMADSEWADVQWKDVEIDLNAYTGTVRLRFNLEFDRVGADRGWVIDNLIVHSNLRNHKVYLPVVLKR